MLRTALALFLHADLFVVELAAPNAKLFCVVGFWIKHGRGVRAGAAVHLRGLLVMAQLAELAPLTDKVIRVF